jgi:hypothetical protein
MDRRGLLVLLILMTGASAAARAHHSFVSLFDPSTSLSVTGVVTEFEFIAPHSYIRLDVANEHGATLPWELETTSPGQLIRVGVTPQTLLPGDRISAAGNPSRDGRRLLRLLTITMPDGQEKEIQ